LSSTGHNPPFPSSKLRVLRQQLSLVNIYKSLFPRPSRFVGNPTALVLLVLTIFQALPIPQGSPLARLLYLRRTLLDQHRSLLFRVPPQSLPANSLSFSSSANHGMRKSRESHFSAFFSIGFYFFLKSHLLNCTALLLCSLLLIFSPKTRTFLYGELRPAKNCGNPIFLA